MALFSMQDSVDKSEYERYKELMDIIGWFFFDLLILGYVEDAVTGKSFRIPGGLKWAIYIEVNCHVCVCVCVCQCVPFVRGIFPCYRGTSLSVPLM